MNSQKAESRALSRKRTVAHLKVHSEEPLEDNPDKVVSEMEVRDTFLKNKDPLTWSNHPTWTKIFIEGLNPS